MLIPVGYQTHNKQYGTVEGVQCPSCGRRTAFGKYRNKTTGRVMFVPVISITNMAFVRCTACNSAYEVDKKALDGITTGEGAVNAIYARHQQKQEEHRKMLEKYSVGASQKSQGLAIFLAALFTTFGAPFFYLGKPLLGVVCLLLSFGSCATGLFPALFAVVIYGFVLAVRIAGGQVQDSQGKYLLNEQQKKQFGLIP